MIALPWHSENRQNNMDRKWVNDWQGLEEVGELTLKEPQNRNSRVKEQACVVDT